MFLPKYKIAKPDSSMIRIPADFLIDELGIILDSYHGNNIGDHIPFHRIESIAKLTLANA